MFNCWELAGGWELSLVWYIITCLSEMSAWREEWGRVWEIYDLSVQFGSGVGGRRSGFWLELNFPS